MPILSIVIANYNYGRFLEAAIRSVVSQLGTGEGQVCPDEVELIVVDGGSTDNSVEVIRAHADELAYWVSESDGGQSEAFNKGFAKAKGKFLTWLNADDIFVPGALSAVIGLIRRHPGKEWFVGSCLWTDERLRIKRCFCAHRFSVLRAKWGALSVGGPSSVFTKRLLDAVGGVDERLHYMMDTDLWYRFYRQEGAKYVRTVQTLFACRQHEASKMSGADVDHTERALENRRRAAEEQKRLIARYGRRWRFVHLMTLSVIDNLIAFVRTCTWKGCHAYEI